MNSGITTCIFLLITGLSSFHRVGSSKILAVFSHVGKSHFDVFEPYLEQLAARGHQLLVISYFPRERPVPNYKDIDLRGSTANNKTVNLLSFPDMMKLGPIASSSVLTVWGIEACEKSFALPDVQQLINSEEKFDLLITEMFNTDCFLALAHKFKIPIIGFSTCVFMPWTPGRVGNPDNPAYIPVQFSSSSDNMNFIERLLNTVWYLFHNLHYPFLMDAPAHHIAKQHFGESLPPLSHLARNTSLIFVNNHFSLNRPRPLVPGVIEVAGIHIKAANTLPKDIEDYLNGAEHGVIYFNMGSMIRTETLPDEKREAFLQAFSELPQRVLWKWEADSLPGQPKNVRIAKWLPQFDILNHPKVRVFLAHGGLLGTIEAVHVGVPMIGIPMYGDQSTNMKMVEAAGMAVILQYKDITKDNVLHALRTVLDNHSYTENAQRTSRIFRDRPMSPMDTAIYWTEYVIRHRGAPHLRTAGADLPLYQYLLLDVIAALVTAFLTVVCFIYFIFQKLLRIIRGGVQATSQVKKRQ